MIAIEQLSRRLALCVALLLPSVLHAQTTAQATAAVPESAAQPVMLDRVIAIVDEDVILASELQSAVQRAEANAKRSKRELPPQDQFRRQVFDQLVLDSLQLQIATRAGVRIADSELNEQMERVAQQNNMTLEQFSQALSKDGMPYAEAREQLRHEMLIDRVQKGSVNEKVQITDQEIESFLNSAEGQAATAPQFHLMHALVPLTDKSDADSVRQVAAQIAAKLRNGDDFGKVIAAAGSGAQGGDLGWRTPENLPSLFADIVPTLSTGQVTDPIRSPSGFHVLQVVEARGKSEIIQQTKARHILLKPSAIRSEEQCKALAAELRQKALSGSDFSELARQYSEDIGSAMEGGELGWTSPGQLVAAFQRAMDNTDKGAISEPFRSRYGWHILMVEDRRRQDVTEEIRHNIARNYLHERKYQEELDTWLRKIRDEAFVDIKKI